MTAVVENPTDGTPTDDTPVPEGHVRLVIDGASVDAPKGELLIRACERLGIVVPRFCDHPLLDPAGACRQCLVEVEMGGRPMPKPQASCTMTVADGMVVKTQHTSPVAWKAQAGMMELLLINHPLDCPVCDKGGECPLQNQAMTSGRAESRFTGTKRTFPKPLAISTQVLLDRERCVLCQRCTRFSAQIAGDEFIELLERGADQQVGVAADQPFQSYFSGNTIQICPVGALTSAAYRFRSRPFDLASTRGVCEHCASGCAQRTDSRRGAVQRRLAAAEPEVNEEWSCDKGRFAFRYLDDDARITRPQVRGEDGELHEASWTDALRAAAEGLLAAREAGVGVLAGGRLTTADAYAYGKLARVALGTNDVDFRARAHSDEEAAFLAAHVVGATPETGGVTYAELETAPGVVCVGLEPEEESPIVYLRLRKAARAGVAVRHVAAWAGPAVVRTGGRLVPALPGDEASVVSALELAAGSVVLVGERAAEVPGLLSAVSTLVAATDGARVAWVPRRAGERGALAAGALPTLLPGGRAVADEGARAALEQGWRLEPGALVATPGRDTTQILAAAARGELAGLVVGGVEVHDLPDPDTARRGLERAFVVSLELRRSEVTDRADVVLPVAADAEREGAYLDWEGRERPFPTTLLGSAALPDCRVLDTLAVEMDVDLFTQTPAAAAGELGRIGVSVSATPAPRVHAGTAPSPGRGEAVLATWRTLLDHGALQLGEEALAGTARERSARVHPDTATRLGVRDGERVAIATADGACTTVLRTDPGVVADVLWLPAGPDTTGALAAGHGALVTVTGGGFVDTVTGGGVVDTVTGGGSVSTVTGGGA